MLGSDVSGLWHKYSDLSDVNAADANFYYGVIVTGDDFGLVKLFRFPCPKKGNPDRLLFLTFSLLSALFLREKLTISI